MIVDGVQHQPTGPHRGLDLLQEPHRRDHAVEVGGVHVAGLGGAVAEPADVHVAAVQVDAALRFGGGCRLDALDAGPGDDQVVQERAPLLLVGVRDGELGCQLPGGLGGFAVLGERCAELSAEVLGELRLVAGACLRVAALVAGGRRDRAGPALPVLQGEPGAWACPFGGGGPRLERLPFAVVAEHLPHAVLRQVVDPGCCHVDGLSFGSVPRRRAPRLWPGPARRQAPSQHIASGLRCGGFDAMMGSWPTEGLGQASRHPEQRDAEDNHRERNMGRSALLLRPLAALAAVVSLLAFRAGDSAGTGPGGASVRG